MFNSVATIAFVVDHEDEDEATNEELKAALYRRIKLIDEYHEGTDGYTQTCGDDLTDTQEGSGWHPPPKKYYVVQSSDGKFADGFYGWDGTVHSEEQIFAECDLPYKPDSPGITNILVGTGVKPPMLHVHCVIDNWSDLNDQD